MKKAEIKDYEGTYKTLREAEILGWIIIVLGGLGAFFSSVTVAEVTAQIGSKGPNLGAIFVAMSPGIALMMVGFFGIAIVKVGRSNVHTAEMTQEMLVMARSSGGSSVGDAAPEVAPNPFPVKPVVRTDRVEVPDLPKAKLEPGDEILLEDYKGIKINKRYDGTYIDEKWYPSLVQARAAIDKKFEAST